MVQGENGSVLFQKVEGIRGPHSMGLRDYGNRAGIVRMKTIDFN